jgi:hypothetical protein
MKMSVFDGYKPDQNYEAPKIEEGEHLLKVVNAKERFSQAGNELIEIELINKDQVKFYYHVVKNEWFDKRLTQFYDAFGIPYNVQNLENWRGSKGIAFIGKGKTNQNGKQYMEIKYLVVKQKQNYGQQQQSAPQQKPAQQSTQKNDWGNDGFTDDIPF